MPFNLSSFTSSNRIIYVLVGGIAILIFLVVFFVLKGVGGTVQEKATLQFWGVFDDKNSFEKAIKQFETQNPNTKIEYRQFSYQDYERELINALAAGTGPDLFMIHNTWLAKHQDKLKPLDETDKKFFVEKKPLVTVKSFKEQFVDVAAKDFISNNQIYALPLYVDTLALYYNKDLFNAAGIARPPATWNEFNDDVQSLTKLDDSGNISQSGAAIGSARNINRSIDILMNLMIQSGVQMTNKDDIEATFAKSVDNQAVGERALQYYTDFTNPQKKTYCWNDNQHYSIDAFVEGRTTMMFNYAYQSDVVRGKNPRLNFGTAPIPQISNADVRTYANYWAPAVAAASIHPLNAWRFLAYLTSKEGALTYLTENKRPSARRDIISLQKDDPDVGVFAEQALAARSWYQVDSSAIETIFADMIDDVNLGRASAKSATESAQSKVNVLMSRRQR